MKIVLLAIRFTRSSDKRARYGRMYGTRVCSLPGKQKQAADQSKVPALALQVLSSEIGRTGRNQMLGF